MIYVALISDTHEGITKRKSIAKMLDRLGDEPPIDILIHAGDYCGGVVGHRTLRSTVELVREYLPHTHFLSVIGNHDYWHAGQRKNTFPSMRDFEHNYQQILEIFKLNSVHFLDTDGPFRFEEFCFLGASGWYSHPNPPTNDINFLPRCIEGNTHTWMHKRAMQTFDRNLMLMGDLEEGEKLVFVSHFPVIEANDYKGRFSDFSWCSGIDKLLIEEYGCQYFLCGHAHSFHNGPLRYEAGSDYTEPKYQIIELGKDDETCN